MHMRILSLFVACLGAVAFGGDNKPDDAKKELEKVQGKWYITSISGEGKGTAWMDLKENTVSIKGDQMASKFFGRTSTVTFARVGGEPNASRRPVLKSILAVGERDVKFEDTPLIFQLDATTNPKSIEVQLDKNALSGIYAVDGEQLKICLALPKTERPKDFSGGADRFVLILSRKKPDDAARNKAIKVARESLKGTWVVESGQFDTAKLSDDDLKGFRVTFGDDGVKWEEAGKAESVAIELDPTVTPAAVDFIVPVEAKKEGTVRAVYELKGDQLTLRLQAQLSFRRPRDLTKDVGADAVLVLKRVKP
ncbi:MAG: hypothetical protein C0467_02530 [Planctomycetaceae bacterium]|nr:hypothetical protein [Planctomycetaceae bacterium]